MTDLSSAAQAVMHTYEDWLELPIANQRYGPLAAALRAAADHCADGAAHWELYAIAAELEGSND